MNIFRLCKIFQGSKSRTESMSTESQRRMRGVQNSPIRAGSLPEQVNKDLWNSGYDFVVNKDYKQINSSSSLPHRDIDLLSRSNLIKKDNTIRRAVLSKDLCTPNNLPKKYLSTSFQIPFKVNENENIEHSDYPKNGYLRTHRMVDMNNRLHQSRRRDKFLRIPVCAGIANSRIYPHNIRVRSRIEEPSREGYMASRDGYMPGRCASCPFLCERIYGYSSTPEKYDIADLSSRLIKTMSDHITFLLIENFLSTNYCYKPIYSCLRNILPIYLISGYIYLRRYLDRRLKDFKQLLKIFISCCWIAIKATNDSHISCKDLLVGYSIDPEEISFIEAHILSEINYDIEITKKEILEVIE